MTPPPPPPGRVLVAFGSYGPTNWAPTWTALDLLHPSLVSSYTIDRGRQYELDRTDTGHATVEIADKDNILASVGAIDPLTQIMLGRQNPVSGNWQTRFRGFVDTSSYTFDPSQKVNRLSISCNDIFEPLSAIEMQPGPGPTGTSTAPAFGDQPPAGSDLTADSIYFHRADPVDQRILQVLGDANIPPAYSNIFSGNVEIFETIYSAGESILTVIQDCADAEFPGVANVYTDRIGRLVFHGRLARFDPVAHSGGTSGWDYTPWKAGDGAAVNADPGGHAHIREFSYERGLAKIINSASAVPVYSNAADVTGLGAPLKPAEVQGQWVYDSASINQFGYRSWSAQNLQTCKSHLGGDNSLVETKRFATYYVDNYKQPQDRVTAIGFRSMDPLWVGAGYNWSFLSNVDIADSVQVTVSSAGVAFTGDYFVEGIHEENRPLNRDFDDVTMHLDLSPRAYFDTNPWA